MAQTPRRDKIADAIRESGGPMSPKEISDATGLNPKNVRSAVREMKANHALVQPGYGQYDLPEHHHLDEESRESLRDLRKRVGYTHGQAARYLRKHGLDISSEELADWERGVLDEPPPVDFYDVAQAYDRRKERSGHRGELILPGNGPDDRSDVYVLPIVDLDSNNGFHIKDKSSGIILTKSYIRRRYGLLPDRLGILEIKGDGMKDTLQPGQNVTVARWDSNEGLQGDGIYGLLNKNGSFIRRLRFGRQDGKQVIWIWADNDGSRSFYLTPEEFEQEYSVAIRILEVTQKL